jgi:hypothetical protein
MVGVFVVLWEMSDTCITAAGSCELGYLDLRGLS